MRAIPKIRPLTYDKNTTLTCRLLIRGKFTYIGPFGDALTTYRYDLNPCINRAATLQIAKLSVSETTRKAPLVEARTALGKQKYVLWNGRICHITEIL